MSRLVYNIGLPRTGSTSTAEALRQLGFRSKHVSVPYVNWRAGTFEPMVLPANGLALIMTFRLRDEWLASVRGYRPHVPEESLRRIYAQHMAWFYALQVPVAPLRVEHGWQGLVHALSMLGLGHLDPPPVPFPHLNASPPVAAAQSTI